MPKLNTPPSTPNTPYAAKLKYILPKFLLLMVGIPALLVLARWLLSIKFNVVDVKREVWEVWLPAIVVVIALILFIFSHISPRTRLASLPAIFVFFAALGMLIFSQEWLVTATSRLQTLSSVNEIFEKEKTRYYRISRFVADFDHVSSNVEVSTEVWKKDGRRRYKLYFVAPLLDTVYTPKDKSKRCWVGIEYDGFSAHGSDHQQVYEEFWKECDSDFRSFNYHAFDHYQLLPPSKDRDNYLKAIQWQIKTTPGKNDILLVPESEPYESRMDKSLYQLFVTFIFGLLCLLLALVWTDIKLPAKRRT